MNSKNFSIGEYVANMLIDDKDLERFLLASPFYQSRPYDYSGKFNEQIFSKYFYSYPEGEADEGDNTLIHEVAQSCVHNNKSTIFLLGNKGCGKSTFAHRLKNKLYKDGFRVPYIDFGLPNSTLDYTKSKETIGRNMYSQIRDFISVGNIEPIYNFIDIYKNNADDIDVHFDANERIAAFFEELDRIVTKSDNAKRDIRKKIRPYIFSMELFQIFLLMILLDYCLQKSMNTFKKTIVFLDNLDNLSSIKHISAFLENYYNFRSCFDRLLMYLRENEPDFKIAEYSFVLVMRETTKSHISPHLLELIRISSLTYDLTNVYNKRKIIFERIQYIEQNKNLFPTYLYEQAKDIRNILSDNYIEKTIIPLFNNDYRVSVKSLIKICKETELILEYNELKNIGEEYTKFGGRGIIYRLLFNLFKTKAYYDNIFIASLTDRNSETQEKNTDNTSLCRLILMYLENVTRPDLCDETYAVPLREILLSLKNIPASKIVKCIWGMYNLSMSEYWNHLVTFASTNCTSNSDLQGEANLILLDNYPNSENNTTLRITPAGIAYASNMCTHFEFFSCRIYGNDYPPLFSHAVFKYEDQKPLFYKILSDVYTQVKKCCEFLADSLEADYGICCASNSNFNFKSLESNMKQYHSERLIFTHISYIEAFRAFLLRTTCFNKKNLQKHLDFVIQIEKNYLDLFEKKIAKCSYQNKSVLERIRKQVGILESDPFASYMSI